MRSGRTAPVRTDPLRHLRGELDELERRGLLRVAGPAGEDTSRLILCSNDYLGYGTEPWPEGLTLPGGAGGSRLVSGDHPAHVHLEQTIARWLGVEAVLVFSSGYAANVGMLAALAGPGDVIVSDALNHASIIDGCRLSGATIVVAPHKAPEAIEAALRSAKARRRWVVTESYFSMDADMPDLPALREICDRHDAGLIVDEAHGLGVFGVQGGGLCREAGVRADVLVGTLGKAIGLQGAFVAGSAELRAWLWNRARSFVFSTGLSPALAGAASARVRRVAADDRGRSALHEQASRLRIGLAALGAERLGRGPIIPWLVGDAAEAVRRSLALRDQGVFVQAIRPPTVPQGTSRLRITAHAKLSSAQVERALAAFALVR
jgi:8-amino-7-oxononanoate synthase